MRNLLFYFLLLSAKSALCQTISFEVFNKACDSMTYYDVLSNYSFEISESEKIIAKKEYNKYSKVVSEYKNQHSYDSTEITISIISNYIQHAYSFKKNNKYYLALRSCDKSVDYQLRLSDIESAKYWNPQLSEMHFNRALLYYDIFNTVGFSIGSKEQLLSLLSNVIKNIQTVSSFELTQTFRLFSESELQKKYSIESTNKLYNTFCKEVTRRYENGAISDVQYYLCNSFILEYLETDHNAKLGCSMDFVKVYQTIVSNLESKKIKTIEGAFYFKPYLQWLIRTLPNNDLGEKTFNNTIKSLIDLGIYRNYKAATLDIMVKNEELMTLDFYEYKPLKQELNRILFFNRNSNDRIISSNIDSHYSQQSKTSEQAKNNQINDSIFLFNYLNLFDFESIDNKVLLQINKITNISELSYFSVLEYQIRKNITDTMYIDYVSLEELKSNLRNNEAFIYSIDVLLDYDYIKKNYDDYKDVIADSSIFKIQRAKNLYIVTKNNPPKLFVLNDYIKQDFYSEYNFSINSNQRMPQEIKMALTGIKKIYTYDDPFPWVLLDTDGNYMCLNYEFHKITSLKEIIKKSANIKLDCTSKNAVVYSNPDFNNPPENLYTADIKKQPDSLSRSANDDLAYYFSSNNKGDKNKINLKPLPNSEIEAKEIVGILNRNKIKTVWYNKTNAKEEYVYNNTNPYILHFATHGTQLNEDSLDKAFLFYNALTLCNATSAINNSYYEFFTKKNDGLLTGLEITKLNLSQTELVVLSACETGKGTAENWINGTYYNSLQRAFRLAGAKAVLASKWKVPDKETQELMVEFYTNWLEKKMTKHKALQQAQLTLSKKYPNPKDWAAWVLYGE
jgi:CHAT domain-containing protein